MTFFGVTPCPIACRSCQTLERLASIVDLGRGDVGSQYIYFIGTVPRYAIKIGVATDVDKRRSELSVASPFNLVCLATLSLGECSAAFALSIETAVHNHFAPFRLRREWFRRAEPLLHFLDHLIHPPGARRPFVERRALGITNPPCQFLFRGFEPPAVQPNTVWTRFYMSVPFYESSIVRRRHQALPWWLRGLTDDEMTMVLNGQHPLPQHVVATIVRNVPR